jgi:Protein of unknown function (DUF1579)
LPDHSLLQWEVVQMASRAVVSSAAVLLAGSLFVCTANGQGKADPQSAVEPRSSAGAGQKFLEQFVGDWDVVKIFYSRSGEASRTTGVCRQRMIHEGRFLQSDFTFQQGETKTTGQGLVGFESTPGIFTSVWTDSRATRMSLRQSKDPFDGKQIVLFSRALSEGSGESRSSRTVTELEDNGRKIVHRQYTLGDGGTERLMMELIMTRKGESPTTRE